MLDELIATGISTFRPSPLTEQGNMSIYACMHAKLPLSCPTLCDTRDGSLPGSSVHGILQARLLECPHPGDLPDSGIEPMSLASPALTSRFFTTSATGKASSNIGLSTEGAKGTGLSRSAIVREGVVCGMTLPTLVTRNLQLWEARPLVKFTVVMRNGHPEFSGLVCNAFDTAWPQMSLSTPLICLAVCPISS